MKDKNLLLAMTASLGTPFTLASENNFKTVVLSLIGLFDKSTKVTESYLETAIYEQFSIIETAECWFQNEAHELQIKLFKDDLLEITVSGFNDVYTVILPLSIEPGQKFLTHFEVRISQLIEWKEDLFTSLESYDKSNITVKQ